MSLTLPMSTRPYLLAIELKMLRTVAAWFGCELEKDERRKMFTLTRSGK